MRFVRQSGDILFGDIIKEFDEDIDEKEWYIFKVKYYITGKTHDGYCSGAETEEDYNYDDSIPDDQRKHKRYILEKFEVIFYQRCWTKTIV